MLQRNKNKPIDQIKFQIDLIRSHIVSLKQFKQDLKKIQDLPTIPERIIIVQKQIEQHESTLQQLRQTYNM